MVDDKEKDLAINIYKTLCIALNAKNWNYSKNDEKLEVRFTVKGDDLPILIVIIIDNEMQLTRLYSILTFTMKEEKRIDGAITACIASYNLYDGNFDYDITDGKIWFRLAFSFRKSLISEELFWDIIDYACSAVDKYNDKFYAISEGLLSIEDFLSSREGDNNPNI